MFFSFPIAGQNITPFQFSCQITSNWGQTFKIRGQAFITFITKIIMSQAFIAFIIIQYGALIVYLDFILHGLFTSLDYSRVKVAADKKL